MKKVLITGGSRGIGFEIMSLYIEKGYDVFAPNRSELDLSDLKSVDLFLENKKNITYDIIINNAGINDINYIENVSNNELYAMMEVNLLSPVKLLRAFVPKMKEQNFGRIVNIGSIWGIVGKPGRSIYSATKHGINGVTQTLAVELAPYNILINTVCPGYTLTELTEKNNSEDEIKSISQSIPIGRMAKPEEIARAVYFLGNEDNTYITGQQIAVDGGYTSL